MSSVTVSQSVEIVGRDSLEIYFYLADLNLLAAWNPFVLETRRISGEAEDPDAQHALRMRIGWREFSLNLASTAREVGSFIELHGRGDRFKVIVRFRLREEVKAKSADPAQTVTICEQELTIRVPRRPAGLLAPLLRRYAEQSLGNLKRSLEGAPSRWQSSPWQRLSDHLLIPALFGLSRSGFAWQKPRWTALRRTLEGKNILLTGATSDLGVATARGLARLGAELILVARHEKKLLHLGELIRAETGLTPRLELVNLSLMGEVSALSRRLLKELPSLHVLINNPSQLPLRRIITAEGLELGFANGLLGPFILGETLRPLLEAGQPARLIQVTSTALYAQGLRPDDLESEKADYGALQIYARLRRALLDLSEVWARRWNPETIAVHSVCPGWVQRLWPPPGLPVAWAERAGKWLRSPEQGADTLIWLTAAPEIFGTSGLFWFDRRPRTTALLPGTKSRPERQNYLYERLSAYAARFLEPSPEAELAVREKPEP